MNDMIVKTVDVMGDSIMAAKDTEGIIWVGINYFCQGLNMNKKQRDWQVEKVQSDKTLKNGCRELPAGVFDIANSAYALRLDYIPLWLAKISITNKMEKDHPKLADKLLEYQLKAKDILAEGFLPQKSSDLPMTTDGKIALLAQGHMELKEEIQSVKSDLESLKMDLPILPVEADSIVSAVKKRGVEILGGKQSKAYNNRSLRQQLYNDLYVNLKHNFNVRSYKAIKRKDAEKAIQIVERYRPPLFIDEQIVELNGKGGAL